MLEVRNLKKNYGKNVIFENVNFTVDKGDSVVIIGGSGVGKSTLLRCINKLNIPDGGEILFNGKNILDKKVDINEYRQHVGMVYQQFNLFEHLNVMENMILAPMKVLKMSESKAIAKAEELLKLVGMENFRYQMPNLLSGGQKQRVAIARTLIMEPDIILFDEPTSALDPTMVDEVESVIQKLIDQGMTSIIVTHEMRFAQRVAKKVIFLAEKGIYEEGTSEEIFKNPQKELTRQFIYRSNIFSKTVYAKDVDYYALVSEFYANAIKYGWTKRNSNTLSIIFEEVLLPLLKLSENACCNISMAFKENGEHHKLFLEFKNINLDDLNYGLIDEFGLKMVRNLTNKISSNINENGNYEICAEI